MIAESIRQLVDETMKGDVKGYRIDEPDRTAAETRLAQPERHPPTTRWHGGGDEGMTHRRTCSASTADHVAWALHGLVERSACTSTPRSAG